MPKASSRSKPAAGAAGTVRTSTSPAKNAKPPAYEPPRLTKFDKLDKLIVCGE